jgi:hypothetical protein
MDDFRVSIMFAAVKNIKPIMCLDALSKIGGYGRIQHDFSFLR